MTNTNLTPALISGVSCYEQDGTVYLKLEDVARGLGFTQTQNKNGTEYTSIRWERVEQYLEEFGFPHKWGKDSYIPENVFYRLAMKANNPVAEKFQALVADEIIPNVRKTGFYAVANKGGSSLQALDLIVQSLHEQQDTMNRLRVNVSSQGAEIEKLKEQTDLNREAFSMSLDNWRDNANKVVRQIVFAKAGGVNAVSEDYEAVWNEVYTRMDARGLNMKRRLSNLQKEFPGKKFKRLAVIELANDSKRLIHELRSVFCEMCVYYGVRLSADQAKTVADIQADESQTSLFDRACAPAGRLIGAEVSARG